ncbi:MAG: hypothetical protein A2W97_11685 [Bacteroidetes bacterium GWE2_40_63]|nr:MAG: hypothetical protein A2W97_11685 [Bacteroidetes bacterium GWE2_40_63]OFZ23930.1 MAG: hypothetical protein A2437_10350 [Bacteroidetes bacterium RIFOXYC2_FULL_40_12]
MKNLKFLVLLLCIATNTSILSQNSWIIKTPYLGQPYGMIKTSDNYIYLATKYLTNTEGLDSIYIFKYNMQGELLKELTLLPQGVLNMFESTNGEIVLSQTTNNLSTLIYRFLDIDIDPEIIEVPLVLNSLIEGNEQYKYLGLKVNNDTIYGIANDNSISLVLQSTYNNGNETRARKLIKTRNGYFIRDNTMNE